VRLQGEVLDHGVWTFQSWPVIRTVTMPVLGDGPRVWAADPTAGSRPRVRATLDATPSAREIGSMGRPLDELRTGVTFGLEDTVALDRILAEDLLVGFLGLLAVQGLDAGRPFEL